MTDAQGKQLILLLDGTWNDADDGRSVTNIVRLRELINQGLTEQPVDAGAKGYMSSRSFESDGRQRLIFYQRGVGTSGFRDRLFGGAFGEGVDANVRRAYKFLARRYEPRDQIFIFGFSRGAFTARSLVGLIACSGLLRAEYCSADLEKKTWDLYRTSPNDRFAADFEALAPYTHDPKSFEIACVGVFDTVGALGIPLNFWWRKNRQLYGFHDVELGATTRLCLHALAIDEHRAQFRAACWEKPRFKALKEPVKIEQVWFPGAHADVGGGYIDEAKRIDSAGSIPALDDLSLDWLLRRVKSEFHDFPVNLKPEGGWRHPNRESALAEQHHSRSTSYWFQTYVNRAIANYVSAASFRARHPVYLRRDKFLGSDRYAKPIWEMIHISALERYGELVEDRHRWRVRTRSYRPPNLTAVLPYIGATYRVPGAPTSVGPMVQIVDWDGKTIPTNDPDQRIAALFDGDSLRASDFRAACDALRRPRRTEQFDAIRSSGEAAGSS